MKELVVYTTGEVARILDLSVSYIRNLCERAEDPIPSRLIPGSRTRRIDRGPFLAWLGRQEPELQEFAFRRLNAIDAGLPMPGYEP